MSTYLSWGDETRGKLGKLDCISAIRYCEMGYVHDDVENVGCNNVLYFT